MKKSKIKRIKSTPKIFSSNLDTLSDNLKSNNDQKINNFQSEINSKKEYKIVIPNKIDISSSIEKKSANSRSTMFFDFMSDELSPTNDFQDTYDLFSSNEITNQVSGCLNDLINNVPQWSSSSFFGIFF